MKTTLTTTTEAAVRFATVSPSEGSNTSNISSNSKRSGGARRFRLDRGRRSSAPAISISPGDLASIISDDNDKELDDKNDIFVYTGIGTTGAGVHVHVDDEQQRREEQATAKAKTDPTGGVSFLDAKEKPPRIMTDSMRELLKIDDGAFSPTVSLTSSLRTKTKTKTTQSSNPSKPSSTKPSNGDEDYTAHVCFGDDAAALSPRSSVRATRGRHASRSPPPPSVSERSTSPSLPRKIRQFKNKPQLQHVNVRNNSGAGLQYKRRVSASTPNLAAMASSADLNMDNKDDDAAVKDEQGLARVDSNLMNNLSIFIPLSTGEPVSTVSKMKRSKSELILLSPEFGTRLMRVNEQRDPLFYYEVKKTLGKGSMGSVALVQKRSQTVGGSARKLVRDSITQHKRKQECFRLPFGIGNCFRLCINDKLQMVGTSDSKYDSDDDSGVSDSSRGRGRRNRGKGRGGNGRNNSSTNAVIDPPRNYNKKTSKENEDTNWWTASASTCSSGDSSTFATTPTSSRRTASTSKHHSNRVAPPPTEIIPEGYQEQENDYEDNLDATDDMHTPPQQHRKQHPHTPRDYNYAMKSIHLSRVNDNNFVQELKNEIAILKKLDHPHIVKPIETFHWKNQIFIIMEVCSGGDLYSRDPYSEEEAARIISSVLSAVSYMHSNNVAHRDLKYENVLFVNESPTSTVKLIDFGLSKIYVQPTITEGVGTIYTMAPEVLKGSYTKQADVWSIGVIAYMLLSSQMPFFGRKRQHIVEQILSGDYDFRGKKWTRIGAPAKEFVRELLVVDPDERLDTEHASACVWLNKRFNVSVRGPREREIRQARKSMTRYAGYTKLKKMAMMVVAHRSTCDEIGTLRKLFQKYSSGDNGCISYDEFRNAWKESGLPPEDTKAIFDACDLDGSGRIRYTEFIAATIEAQGDISEERLAEAFDRFDTDDSGNICVDDLAEILGKDFPRHEIQDIIGDAVNVEQHHPNTHQTNATATGGGGNGISTSNGSSSNGNGNGGGSHISYSAFLALWERNNKKKVRENKKRMLGSQCNLSALVSPFDGDDDTDTTVRSSTTSTVTDYGQEGAIARATFLMDKHGINNNNNNNHNKVGGSDCNDKNPHHHHVGFEDTMIAISTDNRVEQKIVDDPSNNNNNADGDDWNGGIVI